MTTAPPLECQDCHRPNSVQARRCIWCGVPLADREEHDDPPTLQAEVEYLSGIERFDEPSPVTVTVSRSGVEIREIMPGTRSCIIEWKYVVNATVVDATYSVAGQPIRPKLWWLTGPIRAWFDAAGAPEVQKHDYILTIAYNQGDRLRHAVFHREGGSGHAILTNLAKVADRLVRRR